MSQIIGENDNYHSIVIGIYRKLSVVLFEKLCAFLTKHKVRACVTLIGIDKF